MPASLVDSRLPLIARGRAQLRVVTIYHLLAFEYELMQLAALFNYDQHSRSLLCILYQLKVLLSV